MQSPPALWTLSESVSEFTTAAQPDAASYYSSAATGIVVSRHQARVCTLVTEGIERND